MRILLIFLFSVFTIIASAQQYTVAGKCTDNRGVPVDGAKVASKSAISPIVYTDENGNFQLKFSSQGEVEIDFKVVGTDLNETRVILVTADAIQRLPNVKFKFQQEIGAVITHEKIDPFVIPKLPTYDLGLIPLGGVERSLIYTTAASSNNELTSNYNVRGGSYDENLVYVNGFNIYRPFLTRSGQQEGMSFIHSSLVESISFSAGGFESQYGDKLSSVLDIKYKTPNALHGSAMVSLLGVESHFEDAPTSRFNYIIGARYRSNGYLLNSLPTKGAYNPVFWDGQFLTNYALTENLNWSVIGHFSSNNYRFAPQTQQTDFGTANEAYSFNIYFDGQEQTRFRTLTGGTALKWKASEKTNLDFFATVFNSDEREYFDIQGQYFINELETDPSKEEFGDSIAVLGVGTFLNHARNKLQATIINIYHDGSHSLRQGYTDDEKNRFISHDLKWGVNFQMDDFYDKLSEWKMIDSAGYSLPQTQGEIKLFETIKGQLDLKSQRFTSYLQMNSLWSKNERFKVVSVTQKKKNNQGIKEEKIYTDTIVESPSKWALSYGVRAGYTTANDEFYLTPRVNLKYFPRMYMVKNGNVVRRNVIMRMATGLYYQPPFYREFRTFEGDLNLDVKAQKSAHIVVGSDIYFNLWDRESPFKFTAEAYYKYMWDVNPYEIENVRTRYYANNDAVAYAYGLDLNVHGQFVNGIESFFKVGLLSTKEDVLNDFYYDYFNAAGEKIRFGISEDQTVVDSSMVEPGFIPRPTDQMVNFGALIQDRMPKFESFSVQVGVQFGSRLPYGPPDRSRYKDTLRQKSYFRVDLGMSYDFLYKEKEKQNFITRNFTDAILSFEVFNLLGVNNVLSKQWIQDVEGKYYSIPNYLTQRRFNLKMILRF
jgi:hypothetical protein